MSLYPAIELLSASNSSAYLQNDKSHLDVISDFYQCTLSRLVSKQIRTDVLNGKAKFGIGSAGKELCQIALSRVFRKGDYFSGYYRDQTFMMAMGLAGVKEIFSALYGDAENDAFGGGRNMNNNFATPFIDTKGNWLNLSQQYNVASALAPLAGQLPKALGLALASKFYKHVQEDNDFTSLGNEVSFVVLGDAATSEGIFFETLNAACVMQLPIVFIVQDDGFGISVPKEYQTAKSSISAVLAGFQRTHKNEKACEIYHIKGNDYDALLHTYEKAVTQCRTEHVPVLIHVDELTQLNGHSTSGSHERYKSEARLQWEKENDCLVLFEEYILRNSILNKSEIKELKTKAATELKREKKLAWDLSQKSFLHLKSEFHQLLKNANVAFEANEMITETQSKLDHIGQGRAATVLALAETLILKTLHYTKSDSLLAIKQWHTLETRKLSSTYKTHLIAEDKKTLHVPVQKAEYDVDAKLVNGFEILNAYFDKVLSSNNNLIAFGEDVGKIGGVNQAFAGMQIKYGEHRVFDTGIREWTIVGQGIGMAMRGLRPIAEIQYLDYLVYALPALTDELATLRWRTAGMQMAPVIIRTRGHRLEGIWHSGSPMSMLLGSLKGIHLLTPRNMTQAVGLYNTLLKGNDPAVMIECLNGYRKKELMPSNLESFTVPLGSPEILQKGKDVTFVTYGSCVSIAEEAVQYLAASNILVELIDVQTLMPFDLEYTIVESIKKTNRVIFIDEDVPGGGTAYMMQKVIEDQDAFKYLDAKPICITGTNHRPPYGDDGNYSSKPMPLDIVKAAMTMMHEFAPKSFNEYV